MPDKPTAERTEQPTPRRLEKARESGRVPHSQELAAAVTILLLLLSITFLAPGLSRWCTRKVLVGLSGRGDAFSSTEAFIRFVNGNILDTVVAMLPILAAMAAAGVLSNIVVGGWNFSTKTLEVKWDAINPASVMQNFLNPRTLVRLLAAIAKLLFLVVIVWLYVRDELETLAALRWAWSTEMMGAIGKILFGLVLRVGLAVLAIGIADALYQKFKYLQDLKMTRQEVRQERKDLEGAPEVKARIRRIQVQMSMRRLKQQVPKASVILVNPTHVAVALRYEPRTMEAPVLLVKGADLMAERIVKIGRSYGVPIVRRPEVARTIYATVKPGQTVPEALYVAVAEVLAMLYRLRQKKKAAKST
jgi:flagellar biosynthetic protein FlhB